MADRISDIRRSPFPEGLMPLYGSRKQFQVGRGETAAGDQRITTLA